jgi:hypothetical protein
LHTYNATTTPPPWSRKVWWSGIWDQQHGDVVLMVDIFLQGFAKLLRRVEEWRKGPTARFFLG